MHEPVQVVHVESDHIEAEKPVPGDHGNTQYFGVFQEFWLNERFRTAIGRDLDSGSHLESHQFIVQNIACIVQNLHALEGSNAA